jgi:HK97 family phage portal protein
MLQKAVTTIHQWLVVGPSPKVQDPHNAAARGGSSSGVAVTDQSAMGVSTFFACVRLIASTIASLPFPVFRTDSNGIPTPARDTQLWKVLHESPNADQTPTDFIELLVICLLLKGNAFAHKVMEGGRLIALEPIQPDLVTVRRDDNGNLRYRWAWGREKFDVDESEVFHVRGFGGGPMGGLSTLHYARESLGIAIAADRAAGSMFANGARPTGVLKFKEWLDPAQRSDSHDLIESKYAGSLNSGRPMILEGGSEWQQISMNADDAQLLESRGWSVEEICRWFGVPPFMIGHNEKTTSWGTGIEQMLLGFQKFTLNPYLRRIEQAVRKQLLSPADRRAGLFAEFNLEGLLRADSQGRMNFYRGMSQIGAMTRNEIRAKENLPPIEGGDVVTIQSQNVPLRDLIEQSLEAAKAARAPEIKLDPEFHIHLPARIGEKTIVTKHDSKGRIAEFERRPIEDK